MREASRQKLHFEEKEKKTVNEKKNIRKWRGEKKGLHDAVRGLKHGKYHRNAIKQDALAFFRREEGFEGAPCYFKVNGVL